MVEGYGKKSEEELAVFVGGIQERGDGHDPGGLKTVLPV